MNERRLSSLYLRRSLSEEDASSLETIQSVDLCKVNSSSRTFATPAALWISESLDFRPPGSRPNRRTQSTPPCGPMVRWWLNWSPPDASGSLGSQSLRLPTEKFLVSSQFLHIFSTKDSRLKNRTSLASRYGAPRRVANIAGDVGIIFGREWSVDLAVASAGCHGHRWCLRDPRYRSGRRRRPAWRMGGRGQSRGVRLTRAVGKQMLLFALSVCWTHHESPWVRAKLIVDGGGGGMCRSGQSD